jgi:hypothetical protein
MLCDWKAHTVSIGQLWPISLLPCNKNLLSALLWQIGSASRIPLWRGILSPSICLFTERLPKVLEVCVPLLFRSPFETQIHPVGGHYLFWMKPLALPKTRA